MKIPRGALLGFRACLAGQRWFACNFPANCADYPPDYQTVLHKLIEQERYDYAAWLQEHFATEDARSLNQPSA